MTTPMELTRALYDSIKSEDYEPSDSLLYPAIVQSDLLSKDEPITIKLPRSGLSKETCGIWYSQGKACKNPEHFEKTFKPTILHCFNPECPVCADPWAWREADTATTRLVGCRQAYVNEGIQGVGEFDHVMFSVPPDTGKTIPRYTNLKKYSTPPGGEYYQNYRLDSLKEFLKRRDEFNRIVENVGAWGGAKVFHPYRFKHNDGSDCKDKKSCLKKHYRVVSPHWHVVGIGYLTNSEDFYKATGWVYKKIQKGMGNKKIRRVIHYELTHCGLIVGVDSEKRRCQALTYFGAFNPWKIKVTNRKSMNIETCEICDLSLYEVRITGRGDIKNVKFEDVDIWGNEIRYSQIVKSYNLRWKPMRQATIVEDYRGITDRG